MPEKSCGTRRRWREEFKRQIVAEASAPGVSVAAVARRYDLNANQVFNWRRRYGAAGVFLPVQVVPEEPPAAVSPAAVSTDQIGITLANGRRLDIALSVDDVALVRLVQLLERT